MVKVSTTAARAALLATVAVIADAPTSPNSQTRLDAHADTGGAAQQNQMQANQMRASKILGDAVYTARNTKIGKVRELIIDKDGRVAAVIIDVAFVGLGEKSVAVSLGDITVDDNHLILDRTTDELQEMASYRLESDNDRASRSSPNPSGPLTGVPAQ